MRSPIYGRMFWSSRKKSVRSGLRLSARSRSSLAPARAARTRSCPWPTTSVSASGGTVWTHLVD